MRYCIQLIAMGYVQPASQQKRWVANVACNSACGFVDVPTYVLLVHENESRLDSGTEFFGKAQELLTCHERGRMGQTSEEHTGKHHVG